MLLLKTGFQVSSFKLGCFFFTKLWYPRVHSVPMKPCRESFLLTSVTPRGDAQEVRNTGTTPRRVGEKAKQKTSTGA